jgi:TonB family protein
MNTHARIVLVVSIAAIAAPVAALARSPQRDPSIVVLAKPVTLQDWSKRVSRSLGRAIVAPAPMYGHEGHEGVVEVRFLTDAEGAPTDVILAKSSQANDLDNAAMRAVRRIKTFAPMPKWMPQNQRYAALILFANSQESHDRQIKTIVADATRRNSWYRVGGQRTAMLIGPVYAGQ